MFNSKKIKLNTFAESLAKKYNGEIEEQNLSISAFQNSSLAVKGFLEEKEYRFNIFSNGVEITIKTFKLNENIMLSFMKQYSINMVDCPISDDFPEYSMPIYVPSALSNKAVITEFLSSKKTLSALSKINLSKKEKLYIGSEYFTLRQDGIDLKKLDNRICVLIKLINGSQNKNL